MNRIIVPDAGPLISAARAGRIELIKEIYTEIIVPEAVMEEIVIGGKGKPGSDILAYDWIHVHRVEKKILSETFYQRLGKGESEALTMAIEMKAIIFADEVKVIQEAR